MIDYGANRWRESWNSIPQYGGGGSIYDHGSFGGGSFTLGQILEQSDPFKYRGWYFDREKGEWIYFDELTRQYYYNKSTPYWGTGFVQVKADMGEYVRWVRDFGVQSTRIYLDASKKGDGLLPPVGLNYPITSPYTEDNRHIPELNQNRPHRAIDIGTPVRTPIVSPQSGKVVMAKQTDYGLAVIIKHDYIYNNQYIQTGYAHLSEMYVTQGMSILRGDTIGLTGTYGTGPHLHFTLRIGIKKVNPTILFPYK